MLKVGDKVYGKINYQNEYFPGTVIAIKTEPYFIFWKRDRIMVKFHVIKSMPIIKYSEEEIITKSFYENELYKEVSL